MLNFKERDLLGLGTDAADGFFDVPFGEEAMFLSNAGGEDDILQDILDNVRGKKCI